MSPPTQPRSRTRKPKTRTGCRTCKIRKVKCDEGKPSCARCLKFGAECEGYEVGRLRNTSNPSSLKRILPQTTHSLKFLLPSVGNPFTAVFEDNREYSYFLYFQEEAAIDVSGPFDRGLWNHVIIQASWNEPSLSGLVASLGALYKAGCSKSVTLSKGEKNPHQQYAFQQYGQALKNIKMRVSANQNDDTIRIALIASLLIYCFENFYGELDAALEHLEGALRLMHKQLTQCRRRYKHSENSSPTSALDDDLVAAFFRLDSGLLSRDSISRAEMNGSRLGMNYLEEICEVPERFNTISEARSYLENIQFPTIPSMSRDLLLQISKPSLPIQIDENARHVYTTLLSQTHRWNEAFAPFFAETCNEDSKRNFFAAATLRVRALSTELGAKRLCAKDLSFSDLFNPESREIIDLSKLIAADPSFRKSFVWDCGIIPGLSLVVTACLDRSIRVEALQVLKQLGSRREGTWDCLTAVQFGERCLQMTGDN